MIYNFYLDFLCKKAEGLEPLRFFSFFMPLFFAIQSYRVLLCISAKPYVSGKKWFMVLLPLV